MPVLIEENCRLLFTESDPNRQGTVLQDLCQRVKFRTLAVKTPGSQESQHLKHPLSTGLQGYIEMSGLEPVTSRNVY